jgi:uridine phosphorylase
VRLPGGSLYRARAVTLRRRVEPVHLRPAAELADRVLLPGDPHRALLVAQHLLDAPKMFNHARGLWGYTGVAGDGELLSVQSTGMGGPSVAVVCEELIGLGARCLVRIGTCGALSGAIEAGELLAAETVLPADGASGALGAGGPLRPDPVLQERLVAAGARPAMLVSSDLFYDPREGAEREWIERGAVAVEMEAAALFTVAARKDVPAACVVGVTDVPGTNGVYRMAAEEREALGIRLGDAGYAAVRSR